ncbi:MAG: hypothetical protein ABIM21_06605 [candidate division WOR-3 bacterium]
MLLLFSGVAFSEERVFIVPFENFSEDPEAFSKIKEDIISQLEKRGYFFFQEAENRRILD